MEKLSRTRPLCRMFIRSLLMVVVCALSMSNVHAQKLSLNYQKTPLLTVLKEIQKQTPYTFVYNNSLIDVNQEVSITASDMDITAVVEQLFADTGITWQFLDKQISLSPKVFPQNVAEQGAGQTKPPFRGTILDEEGNPLPGAVVIVKDNPRKNTSADISGKFELTDLPLNTILVVSFLGYENVEYTVTERNNVNIQLTSGTVRLDDVVVTGYQTISRERATGSYVIANEEMLSKRPSANISNALTGIVPGMLTVTSNLDGQNRFLIRGKGTMQQTSQSNADYQVSLDPLIVVDGMPIQGFSTGNLHGAGFLNAKDPFSTVNPNDVETITVLKDAAATSIYGARAANGVIVITTKKGKGAEKLNIRFESFVSVGSKPDLDHAFNMASAESTIWYMENLRNYYPSWTSTWFNPYYDATNPFIYINDVAQNMYEYYDAGNITQAEFNRRQADIIARGNQQLWKKDLNDLVYRNSVEQQYNLSLRGGSEKLTYSLSAMYNIKDAYLIGDSSKGLIINSINSYKITNKLTFNFGLNTSLSNQTNNGIYLNTLKSSLSPWSRLVDDNGDYTHLAGVITYPYTNSLTSHTIYNTMYEPIYRSLYDGKTPASWLYNPVADRQYLDNTSERFTTRISAGLDYKILDELKLSVSGQYERNTYSANMLYKPESYYMRNLMNRFSTLNATTGLYNTYLPTGGAFNDRGDIYTGYVLRAQADYGKTFGKHDIVAIAGTEIMSSTQNNIPLIWRYGYNENTNAVLSSLDYVNQRQNIFGVNAYMPYIAPSSLLTYEDRFFSAYTNAAYTYDEKYTLSGSLRADASNYQAASVRDKFSPFWSVGASWIISREEFAKGLDWVDFLKLRASIGEAGIAAGKGITASVTTLGNVGASPTLSNNEPATQISARGNPALTWEKSRTIDLGLEYRLWNDKLYGNFTWYNKYSYDVLTNASVPIISQGVTSAVFNNAAISNKGIEISLGSRLKIVDDLEWNGMFNFSYNKNKVLEYNVINTSMRPDYYAGYPINGIWVYKTVGYTPEGYIILQGKDGTQEIADSRDATHLYDSINGAAGETVEDYNWTYFLGNGVNTMPAHFGFTNTFTWRGITLSFLLTGKFGYYIPSEERFSTRQDVPAYASALDRAMDTFNKGYANSAYAGMPLWNDDNSAVFSAGSTWMYYSNLVPALEDYYLKGDHIRLNEVYLGYELPNKFLGGVGNYLQNINLFVQARNLGVIWSANNRNIDPDYLLGEFKPLTTFTFGVKFNLN